MLKYNLVVIGYILTIFCTNILCQSNYKIKNQNSIIELGNECNLLLSENIDATDSLTFEIIAEVKRVMLKIQMILNVDSINIDLEISDYVIPNWGIAGIAKDDYNIWLGYNPENINFKVDYILRGLSHEIHHIARGRRPHKKKISLHEQMIHEGLADHFMVELLNCEPPPWCLALKEKEITYYLGQINKDLRVQEDTFELFLKKYYEPWFFGTDKSMNIPKWTGYSLSWYIVDQYLIKHPEESSSSLAWINAETIINYIDELR